jgi:hypothetical protein
MRYKHSLFLLIILLACDSSDEKALKEDLAQWQLNRKAYLRSDEGFINLAGLYWLENEKNSLGSNDNSDIVLPSGFPSEAGAIIIDSSHVRFEGPSIFTDQNGDSISSGSIIRQIDDSFDARGQLLIFHARPGLYRDQQRDHKTGAEYTFFPIFHRSIFPTTPS